MTREQQSFVWSRRTQQTTTSILAQLIQLVQEFILWDYTNAEATIKYFSADLKKSSSMMYGTVFVVLLLEE